MQPIWMLGGTIMKPTLILKTLFCMRSKACALVFHILDPQDRS